VRKDLATTPYLITGQITGLAAVYFAGKERFTKQCQGSSWQSPGCGLIVRIQFHATE